MLDIEPDPEHPNGGHAVLSLAETSLPEGPVTLTLRNRFNDKYLNASGWQATKAYFGPYEARRIGDRLRFVVGSEIVNLVDEYTPVSIEIDGESHDTTWPDDIVPGPPSATIGGVSATPPKPAGASGPALVGQIPREEERQPGPEPEPEPDGPEPRDDETGGIARPEPVTEAPRRTGPLLAGVIVAALAVGAAIWFAVAPPIDDVSEQPVVVTPPVEEVAEVDPCSDTALSLAASGDFDALIAALRRCGSTLSTNTAFELLERRVDENDPAALMALGGLYDAETDIDVIETDLGLGYDDAPAIALDYYARAVAAGDGVGAAEALTSICARLAQSTDALSRSASEDHCSQ